MDFQVTGTLMWYYFICKREVWLMARHLLPDEDDTNLDIGRFIHENTYRRERKEIELGNAKIDLMRNENGELIIAEIKKSSKFLDSARKQLLFYLLQLKEMGIIAQGQLLVPTEKKTEEVVLDEAAEKELRQAIEDIEKLARADAALPPVKSKYCRNCAYGEFCWS